MSLERKVEAEGGCGVVGLACSEPIKGKHILQALEQMKNRGNGKGGGIAAIGLSPEQLGVSQEILREDYLIQIAYLDSTVRPEVEGEFIHPQMDVHAESWVDAVEDYRTIPGLAVKPPAVRRYFCRVKPGVLRAFMKRNKLLDNQVAEDEFIYQNSYALNKKFYASLGDKKAFVLSHGKDMIVLKIVGYGDQVVRYYKLEDLKAHVWIGHHRYPTKGKVWHPGGAHPFVGLHEALVHNGDFSNYHSISEYLSQRNIYPLFLTDTEVAVYLFDLWRRVYRYPLEFLIEAMAPTTERDFFMLPPEKRPVYREIQASHIHGSPDGPWFFIICRAENNAQQLHLIGITDTSMLRPQVFALQESAVKIGVIASERQAIDACLRSLAADDNRFTGKADLYWNARGGSHTDGGAFIFTVDRSNYPPKLTCTDKFGREVIAPRKATGREFLNGLRDLLPLQYAGLLDSTLTKSPSLEEFCRALGERIETADQRIEAAMLLTWILDHMHRIPNSKDGRVRSIIESSLFNMFRSFPRLSSVPSKWALTDFDSKRSLRGPTPGEEALLMDVSKFPSEGNDSAAGFIVASYKAGWKRVISFDWRGQRFCGCGLGPNSDGFRIDVYGNPGDYLGSGLDGAELYAHCAVQDQVAQIMKSGKLVIYGDVGQAFMYAAKGGEVYVLGNAAGRPLINAVGRPRVVINGTCLDYLAESFMAGDPLKGGGFVIINGIRFGENGSLQEFDVPYAGGNLFSLASGGAIYMRDPWHKVGADQLNGGRFAQLSNEDWDLIYPYLKENERLFGVSVDDLTKTGKQVAGPSQVFRKVEAVALKPLAIMSQ